jgi:hypothetical protein
MYRILTKPEQMETKNKSKWFTNVNIYHNIFHLKHKTFDSGMDIKKIVYIPPEDPGCLAWIRIRKFFHPGSFITRG